MSSNDEDAEKQRLDWDEYLAGKGSYAENFRDKVTDDISFVVVQNPNLSKSCHLFSLILINGTKILQEEEKSWMMLYTPIIIAYKAGTYIKSC